MSASKDKLQRKQQIAAGTDKRTAAAAKEKAQHRKTTITYSLVAVLLVVFFAFIFIYNSSWPSRHTTAVTIDGQDYTVAQLNYYYAANYMNFYSNYSTYIDYGMFFDPDTSLAEQEYADGMTWRQYFLDSAAQDMAQIQMLNDQAEADGFTLSEEQQAAYDEEVEALETSWKDLGYTNLKQYLNMNYGKGVDEQLVKQELYRTYVASAYSQSIYEGYEYDESELDDYYAEHADELDVIDFAYYFVAKAADNAEGTEDAEEPEDADNAEQTEDVADAETVADTEDTEDADAEETEDTEDADAEQTEDAAPEVDVQAIADAIDGTDEDTFISYLAENVGEEESPFEESMTGSELDESYSEWLLDPARQPGDATAVETDTESYVVMFLGRDTNDYHPVGFRHILVQAEDGDSDGEFSDEEIQAAEDEARELYKQWQDGDATEDSFAELANANSDDTGSNTNGGLYEDVVKGSMVEPINDWLFEDGRKQGDTTVVSYEGPNYTGTHVLYFTGEDDLTYARLQADNALRGEAYQSWMDEHMTDYEPVTSHLKMAGKSH